MSFFRRRVLFRSDKVAFHPRVVPEAETIVPKEISLFSASSPPNQLTLPATREGARPCWPRLLQLDTHSESIHSCLTLIPVSARPAAPRAVAPCSSSAPQSPGPSSGRPDRKSTRLNSSHLGTSYA